jgi:nitroreductase
MTQPEVTETMVRSPSSTLSLLMHLVARRRTPSAAGSPPSSEELAWLLRAATTVPDHGSLRPWRFVVVSGEARAQLGDALARDFVDARGNSPEVVLDKVRKKAYAAPTLIALIAAPVSGSNVPVWEQVASASCCGYAMVLAGQVLGLGAVWKSTALRDGPAVEALFGLTGAEQLLGWINVGGCDDGEPAALRPAPDLTSLVTELGFDGLGPYRPTC